MSTSVRSRRTSRPPLVAGEVRRDVLPSGLQVVTEQIPGSRTFTVGFFVPVGSRHEIPSLHGASHFLEHVLFKGTRRRSAEDISVEVESVGGDLNAYTAKEHTSFYGRVVDANAGLAVDVLTDMLTSSRVRSADVEAERDVILDEIAMHGDDPGEVAAELVATAVLGEQGLGAPVIGSAASIRAMSSDQVVRHWRRHYRPARMVVAATGRVDHERLLDQLGPLAEPEPAELLRPARPTRISGAGGLVSAVRGVEQTTAVLAFPSPGLFDLRRHALALLSLVVGGGMSSRLFVEVRERRGLTYGIDAGETAYTDAGLWSVDWQCAPERLPAITGLVREILLELAEHGITGDELARAKGQVRGQTMLSYEGPVSRMSRLGSNALIGDERTLNDVLDAYDAVTGEDVQRLAAELFTSPPVLALVGPRLPTRSLRRMLTDWPG